MPTLPVDVPIPPNPGGDLRALLAEERERHRLAGLLHDGIGQTLVLARRRAAELAGRLDGERKQAARECVALLDEALRETRSLCFELSPPVLDELGLTPALRWLADDLASRYGRTIEIVDDSSVPVLDPGSRSIVFRALRELLINALKHTPADAEIVLTVRSTADRLRAIVRDTGPGFAPRGTDGTPTEPDGFGLQFVRRQIAGLGGTLELHTEIGGGTRVAIELPATRCRT